MVLRAESAAAFYREFYPRLYRFVYSRIGASHQDVDDLVQETLLQAWRARAGFQGEASPETWVTAIAKNKVADYWRARNRRERREAGAVEAALARIGEAPIPEDLLDTVEMRERVGDVMARLGGEEAELLTQRYFHGVPVRKIAEQSGVSEGAIESRLTRARESFRRAIQIDRAHEGGADV